MTPTHWPGFSPNVENKEDYRTPNDLLPQAKATALKRRTTLKSMIERALPRELHNANALPEVSKIYTYNEFGFPVLKREGNRGAVITNEMISKVVEKTEDSR